ncbi:hypothetical protein BaRGS_00029733 [Batillaria attramentaria]|uniref:Uncharacterized protein n=1 Tax=Batillaria attramentaria TaxID=370345 RepID=A0ABD0JV78_9CAEN
MNSLLVVSGLLILPFPSPSPGWRAEKVLLHSPHSPPSPRQLHAALSATTVLVVGLTVLRFIFSSEAEVGKKRIKFSKSSGSHEQYKHKCSKWCRCARRQRSKRSAKLMLQHVPVQFVRGCSGA